MTIVGTAIESRKGQESASTGTNGSSPLDPNTPSLQLGTQPSQPTLPHPSLTGAAPYHGFVPDFVLASPSLFQIGWTYRSGGGRPRVTDGIRWLVHASIIVQRQIPVWIPDVIAAQTVWGASQPPPNWRKLLTKAFGELCESGSDLECSRACYPSCRLHQSGLKHQHYSVMVDDELTGLTPFWICDDGSSDIVLDFRKNSKVRSLRERKELRAAFKEGRLASYYLPLEVFGPSTLSALTPCQRCILRACTREITRAKGRRGQSRLDRAEVISEPLVPDTVGTQLIECPLLPSGGEFVAFNGNGRKRHGMGYRIVGFTHQGWMTRCGYFTSGMEDKQLFRTIGSFLSELEFLSTKFGLIALGLHPATSQWHTVTELLEMAKSTNARERLISCHLRIYAPADYLNRWRDYFARQMGFSSIPGGTAPLAANRPASPAESPTNLRAYLAKQGVSQAEFARALQVTAAEVNQRLSGKRPWTDEFKKRIRNWLRQQEQRRQA